MNQIGVETTQHVQLNYNPANIGDRILAFFIDGIILVAFNFLVQSVLGVLVDLDVIERAFLRENYWIEILSLGIPAFFYHLFFEVIWNGKSPGKWTVGVQVVKMDGTNPTFGNYLIRWMFRLLEITLTSGLLAFVTVLLNGKGQRLGDIAAKTCVIKTRKKVKLSDTIYSATQDDYQVMYPTAKELSDEQVRTVKEVLAAKKNYEYATWFVMVQRTANIIQNKLGIKKFESNADEFLERIIADYNHLHQS